MESNIKNVLVLSILALLLGAMSFSSVNVAQGNQGHGNGYPTPSPSDYDPCIEDPYLCYEEELSPTPTDEPETSLTPTPELSVTPTPEVSVTPTSTPSATPTPGGQGGGDSNSSSGGSSSPQVIPATTYAPTGNALVNLILGIGLSLLTFGGLTYAKRNIS